MVRPEELKRVLKEREELRMVFEEVLREHSEKYGIVDPEVHKLHHEFLVRELIRLENRKKRREKLSQTVLGGVIIGILFALGSAGIWVTKVVLEYVLKR